MAGAKFTAIIHTRRPLSRGEKITPTEHTPSSTLLALDCASHPNSICIRHHGPTRIPSTSLGLDYTSHSKITIHGKQTALKIISTVAQRSLPPPSKTRARSSLAATPQAFLRVKQTNPADRYTPSKNLVRDFFWRDFFWRDFFGHLTDETHARNSTASKKKKRARLLLLAAFLRVSYGRNPGHHASTLSENPSQIVFSGISSATLRTKSTYCIRPPQQKRRYYSSRPWQV